MISRAFRRAAGLLLGVLVRIWLSTLKLQLIVDPALAALSKEAGDRPWILALWHGQQMALLKWKRRRRTVVLVSRSLDGEMLCGVLSVLGYGVERGSSSRGGAAGLLSIVRRLKAGFDAAFAVDGPRGPRRVAKALGASRAALLGKGIVVPMGAACASAWTLKKSWDHFEIPKPFTRVVIALGAPLGGGSAEPKPTTSALSLAIEEACAQARRELKTFPQRRAQHPAARTIPRSSPNDATRKH